MPQVLGREQQADLLKRGFSRRSFHRISALLTAGAALPFYSEHALAQRGQGGQGGRQMAEGGVKIDSNENPMGPCPEAAEAIHAIVQKGGRYLNGEAGKMAAALAEQEGLTTRYVQPFAGSSDPLHRTVLAFCGKDRPYVVGEPGYEAGARAAEFVGAQVLRVPLMKETYAHDVKAMLAAHPSPGVIYICNPNNPTGTITPKADIDWLVKNKPSGTVILIDEAYIHLSDNAVRSSYHVAADKEVVVLRTFSKIYGMAGLRAGAAMARPDMLQKVASYGTNGMLPVTAMAGATASLKSAKLVPERRKIIADIREDQFKFLAKNNIDFVRSEANMFMMKTKSSARDFQSNMAAQGVYVGRVWPVWPNMSRITVGTAEEMAKFQEACLKVYNT